MVIVMMYISANGYFKNSHLEFRFFIIMLRLFILLIFVILNHISAKYYSKLKDFIL